MEETLVSRVLKTLKERRENVLRGEINCIPSPFTRFRSEFAGIEQGRYYLVSGNTKAAKTQLTSYLFLFNPILYAYYNSDKIKVTYFYYPLEETPEEIMLRFMSFLLNRLSKNTVHVSPEDLKSTREDRVLPEEVLKLLESDEYMLIIQYFENHVNFKTSRNPTGIWKDLKAYTNECGEAFYKDIAIKDEFSSEKIVKQFNYFVPNNPNEYVFIIVDHVSLIECERGMDLRTSINKLSEYMIILRNRYKFIPVLVQQQSVETSNLEAFKANKIRPTMAGLSDSKYTGKDCSLMFGITNPFAFELPSYLGYDITKLKSNARFVEIVLNRHGQSNGICPLFFDGATCTFKELPLPEDKVNIQKVYDFIKNGCVEKVNTFIHFLFASINHLIN